jgi:hypothetical protein
MTRLLSGALAASITLILAGAIAAPAHAVSLTAFDSMPLSSPLANRDIAVGDLNRDGRPDLVAANADGVSVSLAQSDGGLSSPVATTAVPGLTAVALADTDRDGKLDILVAGQNGVDVLPASTGWTSSNATTIRTGSVALAVGDLNRDGQVDVVAAGEDGQVHIARGSNGAWASETTYGLEEVPTSIALVDVDGDGDLDAAATQGAGVKVLTGDGYGGLSSAGAVKSFAITPRQLAVADVNRDGRPDLVTSDEADHVEIALGNGSSFASSHPVLNAAAGRTFERIAVGDVDHDGIPDIVASGSGLDVYPGRGDATFAAATQTSLCTHCAIALSDRDVDGLPDVVWGDLASNTVGIARNTTSLTRPNSTSTPGTAP